MGKTYRRRDERDEQELFIRSKRRAEPDLRKLARALLAIAQEEVAAEAAHVAGETSIPRTRKIKNREIVQGSSDDTIEVNTHVDEVRP